MNRRRQDERGATAVEFAFIVPLLLVLLIGIAEFGHAFQVQGTLSAAAREGVRAMALRNDPVDARAVVRTAAASLDPAVTDDQIRIEVVGGTAETCPTTGAGDTAVRLTITYPMPYLTDFFGSAIELTGTGVMRCNG
ncbi:pilus assembly protein [Blastococcus sp. MG754426]|uniref:TadE/TadG family type IV pilus assembly protein n=1 Tax=unclassified Blastococcus TaxID=2619396 RepID=UPI001EF111F1|nr:MULTISPECIES: TadE family protein [unclassified Blastococcus]MCF6506953.1 pilus assembly protein [Blastococcus sp. MG754426]MCF6511018.1 pilus assembly protein [Blastococcus sp. MG754427]MCF6734420.1 pilus assembly protein [Blastococcus sp. KM273129]